MTFDHSRRTYRVSAADTWTTNYAVDTGTGGFDCLISVNRLLPPHPNDRGPVLGNIVMPFLTTDGLIVNSPFEDNSVVGREFAVVAPGDGSGGMSLFLGVPGSASNVLMEVDSIANKNVIGTIQNTSR